MSIVNGNVFPNTTFPDSFQTIKTFTDLNSSDSLNYTNYLNAIEAGNWVLANQYLSNISPNKLMTALDLNQMGDTIMALQTLYEQSGGTFQAIINEKTAEWVAILNRFTYVGDWNSNITTYNPSTTYAKDVMVIYNNKIWQSLQANNNANVPQSGSAYWKQVYQQNTMATYSAPNAIDGTLYLYIATTDISTVNNPYDEFTTGGQQWYRLTLKGNQGESGTGFNFRYAYNSSTNYSKDDLVTYNNVWYSSLQNSNVGHTPSTSPAYWNKEFSADTVQIPIQDTQPDNSAQVSGDIWFQTITLV